MEHHVVSLLVMTRGESLIKPKHIPPLTHTPHTRHCERSVVIHKNTSYILQDVWLKAMFKNNKANINTNVASKLS